MATEPGEACNGKGGHDDPFTDQWYCCEQCDAHDQYLAAKQRFVPQNTTAEIASDMVADNDRHDTLFSSPEQKKAVKETEGITDQIGKQNWLNVHFRAFSLSHDAWRNHIAANDAILASTRERPNHD